jgi:hypothetical protein
MEWIDLAQARDKWRFLTDTVLKLWVPYNAGNIWTGCTRSRCSMQLASHPFHPTSVPPLWMHAADLYALKQKRICLTHWSVPCSVASKYGWLGQWPFTRMTVNVSRNHFHRPQSACCESDTLFLIPTNTVPYTHLLLRQKYPSVKSITTRAGIKIRILTSNYWTTTNLGECI